MSKIDFKPPVGGTGVFSFVPPATNTDRTVTLPDAGGQMHTSESANDHASMPTVAGDPIVESGSNTDGYWTRYADGTQFASTDLLNEFNDESEESVTYPVPFTSVSSTICTGYRAVTDSVKAYIMLVSRGTSGFSFRRIYTGSGGTGYSVSCGYTATGRWK